MLPSDVQNSLRSKKIYDFGINVKKDTFAFGSKHCTAPTSLVAAYALAVATSGNAKRVLMAGFDGFSADDPRNAEMLNLFHLYSEHAESIDIIPVTPSRYNLEAKSIYAI